MPEQRPAERRLAPPPLTPPRVWADPRQHVEAAITHPWYRAVFVAQTAALRAAWRTFEELELAPALAPALTGEISSPMAPSSDSEPVRIDFLGQPTYLADSMQFGLEALLRLHGKGVWYAMPTFRGESGDARHLNQFFHIEAEIAGGLDDVLTLVERLVRACVFAVAQAVSDVIGRRCCGDAVQVIATDIPRITFAQAAARLAAEPGALTHRHGRPFALTVEGERVLTEDVGGAVWVIRPPHESVPFYQAREGDTALAADLILGDREVVGCGQRHIDGDATRAAMVEQSVSPDNYRDYLLLKDLSPLRSSGFGLGLERLVCWTLEHNDIRDIPLFPLIPEARRP